MKRTNNPLPSINPFKRTDSKKNFFQNATDTLTEVIVLFIMVVLLAGGLFALFEGKDFLEGVWWALVTGFTVGYGDIAPATLGGRAVGIGLMTFSTWVILPLIIVLFIKKHSPDRNEFTDEEQKEILRLLRHLDKQTEPAGTLVSKTSVTKRKK